MAIRKLITQITIPATAVFQMPSVGEIVETSIQLNGVTPATTVAAQIGTQSSFQPVFGAQPQGLLSHIDFDAGTGGAVEPQAAQITEQQSLKVKVLDNIYLTTQGAAGKATATISLKVS